MTLVTTGIAALIGSGSAWVLLVAIRRWITFPTHFGPVVFLLPVAVALVGAYGIRVTWSDGHATGIYTWRLIMAVLCAALMPH